MALNTTFTHHKPRDFLSNQSAEEVLDMGDKELKKKLRNRQSAQRARDRQKARMRWLEREVAVVTMRNQVLQREKLTLQALLDEKTASLASKRKLEVELKDSKANDAIDAVDKSTYRGNEGHDQRIYPEPKRTKIEREEKFNLSPNFHDELLKDKRKIRDKVFENGNKEPLISAEEEKLLHRPTLQQRLASDLPTSLISGLPVAYGALYSTATSPFTQHIGIENAHIYAANEPPVSSADTCRGFAQNGKGILDPRIGFPPQLFSQVGLLPKTKVLHPYGLLPLLPSSKYMICNPYLGSLPGTEEIESKSHRIKQNSYESETSGHMSSESDITPTSP